MNFFILSIISTIIITSLVFFLIILINEYKKQKAIHYRIANLIILQVFKRRGQEIGIAAQEILDFYIKGVNDNLFYKNGLSNASLLNIVANRNIIFNKLDKQDKRHFFKKTEEYFKKGNLNPYNINEDLLRCILNRKVINVEINHLEEISIEFDQETNEKKLIFFIY